MVKENNQELVESRYFFFIQVESKFCINIKHIERFKKKLAITGTTWLHYYFLKREI